MKRIKCLIIALMMVLALTGCNRAVYDTAFKFDYAIIELQNGEVVEGKVESWLDFEDGDQIQVKVDGVTYLVHSCNCTLIKY